MQEPTFEAFNSSDVNLDGFDFNLEGNDDLMLADSKTSNATMDFQFEKELSSSLNDLKFDDDLSDDEDAEPARRPPSNARASRARRSLVSKNKNFQISDNIDFDPTLANQDDISINSYTTAPMTHQVSNALPSSTSLSSMGQQSVFTVDQYNEALEHLAQTMKRTEESRRQVMLQRAILTQQEEQRRQAQEQAAMHAQQAMAYRRASAIRSQMQPNNFGDSLNNGGSSLSGAAAFLTGSSGTLTSGLAQSRRQLQMYMAQMNGQTF